MRWLLLALIGCTPKPEDVGGTESLPIVTDGDGDGFPAEVDCDDADGSVYPGATDVPYDGIDADCAGNSDYDADADGADAEEHGGTDCDDADAEVSPDAEEVCDGVDNNCDGEADGEVQTWWTDADGDGYGDSDTEEQGCAPPAGSAGVGGDCDDGDSTVNPGNAEVACNAKDDDCDHSYGEGLATPDGVNWMDLQGAVDSLASTGGTVTLCEGTFPAVSIAADATVHLIGSELGSKIHANFVSSAVYVASGEVTLERLELTGGAGTELDGAEARGGGLLVDSEDPVRVVSCSIDENVATYGGGIYLGPGATLTLEDTSIEDNDATYGGGVYGAGDNTITMAVTYLMDNSATSGAGLMLERGASVTADAISKVDDNHASLRGGGVDLAEASRWTGGIVIGNNAPSGGGFAVTCVDEGVVLAQVIIEDNHAELDGGGLALACSVTLEDVTVFDNAAGSAGGAFSLVGPEQVSLSACSVTENGVRDTELAGAAQIDEGVLESYATNWGAGSSDNDPVDIWLGSADGDQADYSYGTDATFVCTASGTKECH